VPDFDLLLVLLGEKMGISLLDEEIQKRAAARVQRYRDRIQLLDTVKHPSVTEALAKTFERSGGWWAWHRKAENEKDIVRRDTVYRQGLKHCSNSAEMHAAFANFLRRDRSDPDQADTFYKKALKLDPACVFAANNYASFQWAVRHDFDEAERIFKKVLETHPENSALLGNYANFLAEVRQHDDDAERLYRKVLELDPNDSNNCSNYGEFLLIRKRFDDAARFIMRAQRLNRSSTNARTISLTMLSAILARAKSEDDTKHIESLRALLSNNPPKSTWDFTCVLAFVRDNISTADHALYSTLAARIADPKQPLDNLDALMRRRPKKPVLAKARLSRAALPPRKGPIHKRLAK
jgi:Tfp pilus assembly protein PilF